MSNPYDSGSTSASVLGPTLKFKGTLTADENLLIQGEVEGSIKHTSSLTIGKEGTVKANVKAKYISVEGTVKGDLASTESVTIHDSADIDGNIFSPTVSLREGATFNGSIDMSGNLRAAEKPAPEPEAKTEVQDKDRQEMQKKAAATSSKSSAKPVKADKATASAA